MPPDFDKYSLEDLESSLAGIDRERYPENYERLLQAWERRNAQGPGPSETGKLSPPEGFLSTLQEDGSILIEYTEGHRVMAITFLGFWLTGWTIGGPIAIVQILSKAPGWTSWFIGMWSVGWVFGEYYVAKQLLWMLFGKVGIHLTESEFQIKKTFYRWAEIQVIQKSWIRKVVQVKDAGTEPDSTPTWALQVEGLKIHKLLQGQEYDKSEWLGGVIAKWAGVEFEKAKKPHA